MSNSLDQLNSMALKIPEPHVSTKKTTGTGNLN